MSSHRHGHIGLAGMGGRESTSHPPSPAPATSQASEPQAPPFLLLSSPSPRQLPEWALSLGGLQASPGHPHLLRPASPAQPGLWLFILPPQSTAIPAFVIKGTTTISFPAVSGTVNKPGCGIYQETQGNE